MPLDEGYYLIEIKDDAILDWHGPHRTRAGAVNAYRDWKRFLLINKTNDYKILRIANLAKLVSKKKKR